ncbi:acetate/propionate family kinase [Saccharopolyspora rhizosphaerae]|uniref:Acetate kinase n=1 Tax=Saccharopolyspora rhizosphaerae TaxID=2492662 RepID=A0A426JN64_9PSEU|nr:acetate/propionate family kinase [Saccharopolyspora rhizosphaerae]RRO14682.1 acetate/propionate family kinase [Saccharopolyspora rhizosphaerae]
MALVLTVNPGSSSLQVHLVDAQAEEVLDSSAVEEPAKSEKARLQFEGLLERVQDHHIAGVGYRLVHGGNRFLSPATVDDSTLDAARAFESLAPLHIPPVLDLITTLRARYPRLPHVLCPDTGFHADLPEVARTYAVPVDWRRRYGVRRYGFHGHSYSRSLRRAGQLLGRRQEDLQLLLTHLGGGCSVCAVRNGRSVQTSMGFTPLEGVPMTTRSGSVDPGSLLWLQREAGLSIDDITEALSQRSGLLGLSEGLSSDTRELVKAAESGDSRAELAMNVFAHGVRRELAAEATSLDRVDAVIFTGEIGWDQPELREAVCSGLGVIGISGGLSGNRDDDGTVSPPSAAVPVLVVRPREELEIARSTMTALHS